MSLSTTPSPLRSQRTVAARLGFAALCAVGLLAAPLGSGCDVFCGSRECPPERPVQGTPADFSASPWDGTTLRVSEPEQCQTTNGLTAETTERHDIEVIEETGTRPLEPRSNEPNTPLAINRWVGALETELRDAELDVHGVFESSTNATDTCARGSGAIVVLTTTWADVPEIIERVGTALREDGLSETVFVRVAPYQEPCATDDNTC